MFRQRLVDFAVDILAMVPTVGLIALLLGGLCAKLVEATVPMPGEPKLLWMADDVLLSAFWLFWAWALRPLFYLRYGRHTRRFLGMLGLVMVGTLIAALVANHSRIFGIIVGVVMLVSVVVLDLVHERGDPPIKRDKRLSA